MKPEPISSPKNPLLKEIRRAITRGGLTSEGMVVAEGFHLLEEAVRSQCRIEVILATPDTADRVAGLATTRVLTVPDALLAQVAGTQAPQGVIALVEPRGWKLGDVLGVEPLAVVLDAIQEPGNAGAILRAAEAFGASGAVFLTGTVSPFNAKAVRASAGSLFRLPCPTGIETAELLQLFDEREIELFAALPGAGEPPSEVDLTRPCAIVIGSEARGVRPELAQRARPLRIPTRGVESLNAAVAAGILLYEARRQRMRTA